MVPSPSCVEGIVWACLALGFSIFFGCCARTIFSVTEINKKSWKFYQLWFNFAGSLFGWLALYALRIELVQPSLSRTEFLLFFIGFVGITGHLPYTTYGLITSIEKVATKAIDLLNK
jgi:hypothetical protein